MPTPQIASQASEVAPQLPKLLMYGGGAYSVWQWLTENMNWIAAAVGIVVTIVGFVWNRIDKSRERKMKERADADHAETERLNRRLAQERHDLEMARLRKAIE